MAYEDSKMLKKKTSGKSTKTVTSSEIVAPHATPEALHEIHELEEAFFKAYSEFSHVFNLPGMTHESPEVEIARNKSNDAKHALISKAVKTFDTGQKIKSHGLYAPRLKPREVKALIDGVLDSVDFELPPQDKSVSEYLKDAEYTKSTKSTKTAARVELRTAHKNVPKVLEALNEWRHSTPYIIQCRVQGSTDVFTGRGYMVRDNPTHSDIMIYISEKA